MPSYALNFEILYTQGQEVFERKRMPNNSPAPTTYFPNTLLQDADHKSCVVIHVSNTVYTRVTEIEGLLRKSQEK